jgi:hypothetical protein
MYKEADMEATDWLLKTGHPPHPVSYKGRKKTLSLSRILLKITLFVVIFSLSFHLPDLAPGFYHREQTIREILGVLERHSMGLADITKEELAEAIYEEAIRYNHDPKFIVALIAIESSFRNRSVSEKGAKGLMQIMPYVAVSLAQQLGIEWSGDRTLFDPSLNIKMGSYYLRQLMLDFNDLRLALAAYNYGPTYIKGLMENRKRIPLNYYHRVVNVYQTL